MEPVAPRPFPPVEAGAFLAAVTAFSAGIGTLIGWAAGSLAGGLVGGLVVGIPGGVFVVYRRYRGSV
jgi:hypothetical protein